MKTIIASFFLAASITPSETMPHETSLSSVKKQKGTLIHTSILIQAPPGKVWNILTDFSRYPEWNPFIQSIEGSVSKGEKISVYIEPPDAKGMMFKPKIMAYDTCRELRWLGHFLIAGLFDGEHSFMLIDNHNGTTTFIQCERFRGILIPFFKSMLMNNTKRGFEQMNQRLKEEAEK